VFEDVSFIFFSSALFSPFCIFFLPALSAEIVELSEEGIETENIPWVNDNEN
jgi:hypothetical protein